MNSAEDAAKLKRNQVRVATDSGPEIFALDACEDQKNRGSVFQNQILHARVLATDHTAVADGLPTGRLTTFGNVRST